MNCREAQNNLFAERDGALDSTQRAALDGHVAHCAECRRIHEGLASSFAQWRAENEKVSVPDAEREWHAVRRKIRGGVEAGSARATHPAFRWVVGPVAAAAALALALYFGRDPSSPASVANHSSNVPVRQIARADSVEVPGGASPTVFVDDKSGWLIVWASDSTKEI